MVRGSWEQLDPGDTWPGQGKPRTDLQSTLEPHVNTNKTFRLCPKTDAEWRADLLLLWAAVESNSRCSALTQVGTDTCRGLGHKETSPWGDVHFLIQEASSVLPAVKYWHNNSVVQVLIPTLCYHRDFLQVFSPLQYKYTVSYFWTSVNISGKKTVFVQGTDTFSGVFRKLWRSALLHTHTLTHTPELELTRG